MPAQQPIHQPLEIAEDRFSRSFRFVVENGVVKTVVVERQGRAFTVSIHYRDTVTEEKALETFEADGPVTISPADGGLYITSCRLLLSDLIRLRRTRFF
jgi:hypothetical protein